MKKFLVLLVAGLGLLAFTPKADAGISVQFGYGPPWGGYYHPYPYAPRPYYRPYWGGYGGGGGYGYYGRSYGGTYGMHRRHDRRVHRRWH